MHDGESNDAEKVKADQYAHAELSTGSNRNCSKIVCVFKNIISFCSVQKIPSQENPPNLVPRHQINTGINSKNPGFSISRGNEPNRIEITPDAKQSITVKIILPSNKENLFSRYRSTGFPFLFFVKSIFPTQTGKRINSTTKRGTETKKVIYSNTSKNLFM